MKRILIVTTLLIAFISASAQLIMEVNREGKWGYRDRATGKVIPAIYDEVNRFRGNEALVKKGKM